MKFTMKEIVALYEIISNIEVKDLITAAGVGFDKLNETATDSSSAEYSNLCNFILNTL